jgi:hypothetical protein
VDHGPTTIVDPSLTDAHWSPDGHLVAGADARDLVTVTPDGTGRKILLTAADHNVRTPRWSPDTHRNAFILM